jgi:hypothetical protein
MCVRYVGRCAKCSPHHARDLSGDVKWSGTYAEFTEFAEFSAVSEFTEVSEFAHVPSPDAGDRNRVRSGVVVTCRRRLPRHSAAAGGRPAVQPDN